MNKNIQSIYITPKGYFYKVLVDQKKIRVGKKEFQHLEKKLKNQIMLIKKRTWTQVT